MYATKYHQEPTAGPRSTNFSTRLYLNKVSSPVNFHPNRQYSRPSFSKSNILNIQTFEYIEKFIRAFLTNCDKIWQTLLTPTQEIADGPSNGIFTFDLGSL